MPRGPTGVPGGNVRRVRARTRALTPSSRALVALRRIGLGLLGRGRFARPLGAQVRDTIGRRYRRDGSASADRRVADAVRPRADSLLRDSLAKIATLDQRAQAIRARRHDQVAARARRACRSISRSDGGCTGPRDSLFATGALTVADLLERVAGRVDVSTAGGSRAPAVGSYLGDVRRVRVFYDGFEIDPLDPRERRRARPDADQPLVGAKSVTIEQAAGRGPRLYAQLARATHDAVTRTDVCTGDQNDEPLSRLLRRAAAATAARFSSARSSTARRRRRALGGEQRPARHRGARRLGEAERGASMGS